MDKIFEHVQKNEPDTLQYQILRNKDVPNEFTVWEEVRHLSSFPSLFTASTISTDW